jgi:hypothetical protein
MNKITGRQIGIIVLTIATALIHLILAFVFPPMQILFILNAAGFLILLVAYFLPQLAGYRNITRWLLIAFAAVTIVGYFVVNGVKMDPLGLVTKAIEVALIVLLWLDGRK